MKKILALLIVVAFTSCIIPIKVIETTTTDSTGKAVKTVQKIYGSNNSYAPQASFNIISSPLFHPYYRPVVIPRYLGPTYNYTPRFTPRGKRK